MRSFCFIAESLRKKTKRKIGRGTVQWTRFVGKKKQKKKKGNGEREVPGGNRFGRVVLLVCERTHRLLLLLCRGEEHHHHHHHHHYRPLNHICRARRRVACAIPTTTRRSRLWTMLSRLPMPHSPFLPLSHPPPPKTTNTATTPQ